MAICRDYFHILHADAAQIARHKLGGVPDIIFMLWSRAHTGNAKQVFQLSKKSLLVLLCKSNCGRCHTGSLLAGKSNSKVYRGGSLWGGYLDARSCSSRSCI